MEYKPIVFLNPDTVLSHYAIVPPSRHLLIEWGWIQERVWLCAKRPVQREVLQDRRRADGP